MSDPADTNAEKPRGRPFKPGQVANPAGRPKGSRNKLGEDFLKALQEDFTKHGVKTIETVRKDDPVQYIKTIASILPKEMNLKVDPLDEMTDAELLHRLRELQSLIGPVLGGDSSRNGTQSEGQGGKKLHAVRPH